MPEKNILIAEDEDQLRFSLSGILEDAGYDVTGTADGEATYDVIRQRLDEDRIDLLVLDIQMPKMNGLQLMEKLDEEGIDIPILVMTGFGDKSLLVKIIKIGCLDYIDKPFEPTAFLEIVEKTLKKHEASLQEQKKIIDLIKDEHAQLQRAVEKYQEKYRGLKSELDRAVDEFNSLIRINPKGYSVNFAYKMKPYASLGGDFIGIHDTSDGADLIVADVAGHDLAASYHSVIIKSLFEDNLRAGYSGSMFFDILNELLFNKGTNERMVTGLFASFNLKTRQTHIVSAGYPFMIILAKSKNEPYYSYKSSSPLGMYAKPKFYEMSLMSFPGDRFIFYTDGLLSVSRTDGRTGQSQRLNGSRLAEIAHQYKGASLDEMISETWSEILEFGKYKQKDDMLLAGIEIKTETGGR